MLRIPNASPSGIVTNFETKCTEYFHPRVLVYILRNKAAYLARNSSILNTSSKLSSLQNIHGITSSSDQLHTLQNSKLSDDLNKYHNYIPSSKLEDDLMQLSCSLISCIDYIQPQSAATILLSFTKLNYYNAQLFSNLLDSFKFELSRPKSVSLILYSLSKCSKSYELVSTNFFIKLEEFIGYTLTSSSTHDLTTYLISLAKLRDAFLTTLDHHDILTYLYNIYKLVLNQVTIIIKNDSMLSESTESDNQPQSDTCSFSVFELSNILESFYIIKHYNHFDHGLILDQLALKLPYSINYITDVFYIMDLFNINPKNPAIKKDDRTNLIRLNKRFSENILNDLVDKLELLNLYELSKLAKITNKLRLWTEDRFLKSFTNSFMALFKNHRGVINLELLVPILVYYNRRYESAINREYYQSHLSKKERSEHIGNLNEISDLCGYVCDTLHDYINTNHPSNKIEDILSFTSKLRTNRSLHRIKYNYKFSQQ